MAVTAFLVFCFAQTKSNLGQLVCTPMVNLARAATTLNEHAKQATHILAVETMLQAELRMKQSIPTVAQQIQCVNNDAITQNKKR